MQKLAPGLRILNPCIPRWTSFGGRVYIFVFSFWIYCCYHLSRKPISVVKSVLHQNCTDIARRSGKPIVPENATFCDWKPFDGDNYNSLFGSLDLAFLSTYAVFMFVSGHLADKLHLRHYLAIGTILSGITTMAFGFGYFFDVHSYAFYIIVQLLGGAAQATGWPAVVACMVNWFGKSKRGFFMGIWNAHTSIGNILGSLVAGAFVDYAWGWSFVVPGLVITGMGVLTYFFLAPYPEEVGLIPEGRQKDHDEESTSIDNANDDLTPSSSTAHLDPTGALASAQENSQTVSFWAAVRVPGVIEYSLSLFFSKMVSYTFLFWLPNYISDTGNFDPSSAADLSAVFDLGGIAGGIIAGLISDRSMASATVCLIMLVLGIPCLGVYYVYGANSVASCIGWLIPLGLCVNGPYSLITTAVAADLGTNPSLKSNAKVLATVTGIIDGTGSVGAALGPLLCGVLKSYGWGAVFVMLSVALGLSGVLLLRRVQSEIALCIRSRRHESLEPVDA